MFWYEKNSFLRKILFKNKAYYIPESESIAAFKLIDENEN